jgi:hypothetical protein
VKRFAIAVAAAAVAACGPGQTGANVDLIREFSTAIEVRPGPAVFSISPVAVVGESFNSILVIGSSRLVYRVTVPPSGKLRVAIGLPDAGAAADRDGVLFRIMVATDGSRGPDVMFSRRLQPSVTPGDRGWQDVTVNLSPFSSETVRLFLNTNAEPGARSAWALPRIE